MMCIPTFLCHMLSGVKHNFQNIKERLVELSIPYKEQARQLVHTHKVPPLFSVSMPISLIRSDSHSEFRSANFSEVANSLFALICTAKFALRISAN